jgi:cytoskeletal protein RodZ
MFEIGSTLQEARERRKIGLDQAEAETKIRARYLRALEDEDFDAIPGPTYVRGFLRTYAAHLGLDGQLFVDEYNSRFFAPRDDDPFHRRRQAARQRRGKRRESNVILVALAAIVAVTVLVIVAATYPRGRAGTPIVPVGSTSVAPTINPALIGTTGPVATVGDAVSLVVVADRATHVTVYLGRGTDGKVLFTGTLDPATRPRFSPKARSSTGFTVAVGDPAKVHYVVNKQSQFPETAGTLLYISPGDARIAPLNP